MSYLLRLEQAHRRADLYSSLIKVMIVVTFEGIAAKHIAKYLQTNSANSKGLVNKTFEVAISV